MPKISSSLEIRWPCPDDRLVGKVLSWNNAIAFSDHPAEREALMLKGYFRAGHVLVDQCRKNPHEGHTMIYPILFCYRHALEMTMQCIIGTYGHRYGVSLPTKKDHNLDPLWECTKLIFKHPDNKSAAVGVSTVERLIREFHHLDSRAVAFRYPVKKNGTLISLPDDVIDLINLREVMEGLEHFFSGADSYLDKLCSASDEMQDYC
jgi:hypothetical protein